ncbi:MAG: arginine--tRNA ligase, partial [Victivallales bacterium]|nr:arginine--tRNA ligase [Victivallales bacterium]
MNLRFAKDLSDFLSQKYSVANLAIAPELCPANFDGDLTINCFILAKQLKQNPMAIAAEVQKYLAEHADIAKAELVKAFVNVTLNAAALMRDTVETDGQILADVKLPEAERRKILIEFSAPNTNKPQHLGHVRNNCVGMATASILEAAGHEVFRINLVNDRGIHICKSMIAYQRFGNGTTPEKAGKKGDHLVGDFYVAYDKEYRKQLKELREAHPELAEKDDDELFLQTEIGRAAQDMLVKWEANDPEVRK